MGSQIIKSQLIKKHRKKITTVNDVLVMRRKALLEAVITSKKKKMKTLGAWVYCFAILRLHSIIWNIHHVSFCFPGKWFNYCGLQSVPGERNHLFWHQEDWTMMLSYFIIFFWMYLVLSVVCQRNAVSQRNEFWTEIVFCIFHHLSVLFFTLFVFWRKSFVILLYFNFRPLTSL